MLKIVGGFPLKYTKWANFKLKKRNRKNSVGPTDYFGTYSIVPSLCRCPLVIPLENRSAIWDCSYWDFYEPWTYHGRSLPVFMAYLCPPISFRSCNFLLIFSSPFCYPLWRTCDLSPTKVQGRQVELLLHFLPSPHNRVQTGGWNCSLPKSFCFLRHTHTVLELMSGDISALMATHQTAL